jgi:hypothetical protein
MSKARCTLFLLISCWLWSCETDVVAPDPAIINIHFHYGEHLLQKDLVMDGIAQTQVWLTAEEQDTILAEVRRSDFFHWPDTIRAHPQIAFEPNPGRQFLRVQYQEQDKTVSWYYPLPANHDHAERLSALQDLLITIIVAKPEYKALPPARGGYL